MTQPRNYIITIVGTVDDRELDVLVPSGAITIDIFTQRGAVYEVKAELVRAEARLREE